MNKVILAGLLVISGCASPGDTYTVIIPTDLDLDWQSAIVEGCHLWKTALNSTEHPLHIYPVIGGVCTGAAYEICVHSSTEDWIQANGGAVNSVAYTAHDLYSQHYDLYIAVDVYSYITQSHKIATMSHELGHGMGMHHTQEGTLMCYSSACEADGPTCDDLDQWMSVRSISPWSSTDCPNGGHFQYEN